MANQVIVTNTGNVQVALTPPANVQVQISRAAIGTVTNVPNANTANTVTNNAQPNITSLGTLTSLTSTGNITAPYFIGNVVGNISGNLVVPGTNTAVLYNQLGNAGASDALKFDYAANVLTANGNIVANYFIGNGSQLTGITATNANFANFAGNAFSVSGSNVTGEVAFANTANNVALANVSGAGNIASINLDGNVANLLTGNGTFVAIPTVSANANYANFAGTAFNVSGSNVTGAVANATFATTSGTANSATVAASANSVAGANVSGTVANANYAANAGNATIANSANSVTLANVSGAGNIASINLDGNASNILFGNGTFSAIPVVSNVANANYANFAGTAFSVSGSNVSGEVANAAYANAANTANLATYATTANSVAGANVSGVVANANYSAYANIAAIANSVAVGNVSGIGNIAVINLDGNASNVLFGNGVFGPESGNLNANYANFAGQVVDNTQSNITTLGTLTNVITSGQVTSTKAGNASDGGGQLYLNGGGNNRIDYNTNGTGAPATTTRSAGTKITLYPALSGSQTDYAMGIDAATMWSSLPVSDPSFKFKWYGNTTEIGNLDGTGNLSVAGNITASNINGNVANANYANFAGTAYSVAGANVSGEVANANYSSYANIAASANSVALANVVGIGNIANINLDGSSSNVLFGNGVFAPESTSIANANYANFAGNVINGTSNISIPSANGTIAFSVNNTANLMLLENAGQLVAQPTSSTVNMLRINTYGNPLSDAHRISWIRARGSNTSPTSVNPNDNLGVLAFLGHNGSNVQTNSVGFVRARVDASYTANGANIPIGMQIIVNDTNGGINNQSKTHNFYANGNVTFANSVFVTDSLSVTGNVTGNYIIGNGSSLSSLTGGNVTGEVAFAAVANSVAVANVSGIGNIATVNLDGNVSNLLTGLGTFVAIPNASANANYANFAGNLINGTSNISIPSANGSIAFSANNVANLMLLENGGVVNAFPTSSVVNMMRINTFNNSLSDAHRIAWARARGSNSSPTSVVGGDNLGILSFFGYNGSSFQTNSVGFVRARVDSSYTANGANIPIGLQLIVNDTNGGVNNQTKTHNFWSNGNVSFTNFVEAGSFSAGGNIAGGNLSTSGTLTVNGNTSLGTLSTSTAVDIKGNNTINGAVTLNGTQFRVTQDNANGQAGYSPFFFTTYQSNNDYIPASKFYRIKGTQASPGAVDANSQVSLNQYAVYADSGNTYKRVFEEIVTVTGNDGAGNVTANLDIVSFNTGSNINLQANTYANNVSITSGGFMKLASYTAAALTAITGQIGWMAAVSNSSGGSNPNGMIAFWDTTNNRWSYIHDNSAV